MAGRDTDADWRALGTSEPYWGVISHPNYRRENLSDQHLADFYSTGGPFMAQLVRDLERVTGARPAGRALDFGCGVGRLTEPMADYAREVVGYDISPGMLALARQRGGRATYSAELPAGPFDWINSFIVFQHIPPTRGMALIENLLARLAPGGAISLHVTVWRSANREPPRFAGWSGPARALRHWLWLRTQPAGHIQMYDYDLSAVVQALNRAGIGEATLVATDHDGHHGVIILGRKTAPAGLA